MICLSWIFREQSIGQKCLWLWQENMLMIRGLAERIFDFLGPIHNKRLHRFYFWTGWLHTTQKFCSIACSSDSSCICNSRRVELRETKVFFSCASRARDQIPSLEHLMALFKGEMHAHAEIIHCLCFHSRTPLFSQLHFPSENELNTCPNLKNKIGKSWMH